MATQAAAAALLQRRRLLLLMLGTGVLLQQQQQRRRWGVRNEGRRDLCTMLQLSAMPRSSGRYWQREWKRPAVA
jgi:hypothetical protein